MNFNGKTFLLRIKINFVYKLEDFVIEFYGEKVTIVSRWIYERIFIEFFDLNVEFR